MDIIIRENRSHFVFQVIMNLSNARDIAAPLSIYIAQIIHLYAQFSQAQNLMDYSTIPYESMYEHKLIL